jgi:hypothetical protein
MADPYKSVLESYNESLKPRRLPTAEEQAIETVYPEEYLMGGSGKAVASGLMGAGKQTAKTAARPSVKIGSKVPSPEALKADKAVSDKFYKTPQGQATYEALKKRSEQESQVRGQKKLLIGAGRLANRSAGNISGETGLEMGSQMAEERRNAAGDTYKKGGKVSSASKRGDGCAVRGKTKGKFV